MIEQQKTEGVGVVAVIDRDELLAIAQGLGLTMQGIEVVSTSDLLQWCGLAAAVRTRARLEGRESEISTPEAMGQAMAAEIQRRTTEAKHLFERAGVPAVVQPVEPYWAARHERER